MAAGSPGPPWPLPWDAGPGRREHRESLSPHLSPGSCGSHLLASGSLSRYRFPPILHPGVRRPRLSAASGPRALKALQLPHVQNRHPKRLSLGREGTRNQGKNRAVRPLPPRTELFLPYLWVFLQGSTPLWGVPRDKARGLWEGSPRADPQADASSAPGGFVGPYGVPTGAPAIRTNGRKAGQGWASLHWP